MADVKKTIIPIGHEMGGWGRDYSTSQTAAIEAQEATKETLGQYTKSLAVSMFRQGKTGHIAPGETFTALTDATPKVNALPIAATTIHSGDGASTYDHESFALLDNNRAVRFGTDDVVDTSYDISYGGTGHVGHTAPASAVVIGTIISYGKYVYWSWEDNTDGDIARLDASTGTVDEDYMSSLAGWDVLDKRYPVSAWLGPDNILYWANNGTDVGSYNPATAAANQSALEIAQGSVAVSGCAYDLYSAIACSPFGNVFGTPSSFTAGKVKIYFWDGFSPKPNFIYDIDDFKATKIYNDNGVLKVWTQGKNGTTKVWAFNGGKFTLLIESAQIGNSPTDYRVDSFEQKMHWVSGLEIFCLDDASLHTRTKVHNGTTTVTSVGFLNNLIDGKLYVGVKVGSLYYILKINRSGYFPDTAYWRSRLYRLPFKANICRITLYFSQFDATSSLDVGLFADYNTVDMGGAADKLKNMATINTTNYPTIATTMSATLAVNISDVSSFYMHLLFNHDAAADLGAAVRLIEIEYAPSNKG